MLITSMGVRLKARPASRSDLFVKNHLLTQTHPEHRTDTLQANAGAHKASNLSLLPRMTAKCTFLRLAQLAGQGPWPFQDWPMTHQNPGIGGESPPLLSAGTRLQTVAPLRVVVMPESASTMPRVLIRLAMSWVITAGVTPYAARQHRVTPVQKALNTLMAHCDPPQALQHHLLNTLSAHPEQRHLLKVTPVVLMSAI